MCMVKRDKLCIEIQSDIGKLLMNNKLTLRDILGILEQTKYFFLSESWEIFKNRKDN